MGCQDGEAKVFCGVAIVLVRDEHDASCKAEFDGKDASYINRASLATTPYQTTAVVDESKNSLLWLSARTKFRHLFERAASRVLRKRNKRVES